jgi:hypothetical protein
MPEVLGDRFPTARAGRPVRVDINNLRMYADHNPGKVVSEDYDEKDAQSVRRQFLKLPGYKVMTAKTDEPGVRQVFVMKEK